MAKVLVETSARHVHVTEEALATLFGEGHALTVKKYLSQPGQFASEEKVEVVGPKSSIKNVSILGPVRKANQVELSLTDARTIGAKAAISQAVHPASSSVPAVKLSLPKVASLQRDTSISLPRTPKNSVFRTSRSSA